jgi:hypothetical protein
LRLINEAGRQNIKLSAMTDGSGLLVGRESDPADISLVARGATTALTMIDRDGRKKVIALGFVFLRKRELRRSRRRLPCDCSARGRRYGQRLAGLALGNAG